MIKTVQAFGISLIALSATVPANAINLFNNGGFENNGFGGTTSYYNVGNNADHAIPGDFGWTVPVNNVDIIANDVYGPTAPGGGGAYSLDQVGYGASGGISQTVTTDANKRYTVAFDFTKNGGVFNPTAFIKVNCTAIASVIGSSSCQSFSAQFSGTGAPTVVTISGFGSGNGGVILDNVSLTKGLLAPSSIFTAAPSSMTPPTLLHNLLGNGDFENPGFGGTSSYYNIGTGGDHGIPSDFVWSVPVNNVDIIANGAYGAPLPTGGAYGLDLVGFGSTGAISQSITTVAGKRYTVSVDYSANPGIANPTADILFNGVAIGSLSGTHSWQTFTTTIIGTGSPALFGFQTTLGGSSGGVFLDNTFVTATVPEPGMWAMMIVGFGLIGFSARRRSIAFV